MLALFVSKGFEVKLYSHQNFRGTEWTVKGANISDFSSVPQGFNDNVESLKVETILICFFLSYPAYPSRQATASTFSFPQRCILDSAWQFHAMHRTKKSFCSL